MGVRNRKKIQHHEAVQSIWSRNVAAAFLFVAAAVLFALLWFFWSVHQPDQAKFHDEFLRWLQAPESEKYRSHLLLASQMRDLESNGNSNKNLNSQDMLEEQLENWRTVPKPISISIVYLFGQFFVANEKVCLRRNEQKMDEEQEVDVVRMLIDNAKKASSKKLIAVLDLGDGLRMEKDFLSKLQRQLNDAPENLWVIVSHDNMQSSRWLEQTKSTAFEAAVRQVLREQTGDTDLATFHRAIADWVAALTVDGEGTPLQTVPKVLGRKSDGLEDIKWKWSEDPKSMAGNDSQFLKFDETSIEGTEDKRDILKLKKLESSEGFVVHNLPKNVVENVRKKEQNTDARQSFSSSGDVQFDHLVARLSCDLALYRFAVDGGLLYKTSQNNWLDEEWRDLSASYSDYVNPQQIDNAPLPELHPSEDSLKEFANVIGKFEAKLGESIKNSNKDGKAKSLFHAEQMQIWDALVDHWQGQYHIWPLPAEAGEGSKITSWPYEFKAKDMVAIPKPDLHQLRKTSDWRFSDWRFEETKRFNLVDGQLAKFPQFPQRIDPILDWRWPSDDLISPWRFAKIKVPDVVIEFKPEQRIPEKLEFNLVGVAELTREVSFQNAPEWIELRVDNLPEDWLFEWTVEPLARVPGAETNPESVAPPSSGPIVKLLQLSDEGGQPSHSGEYRFTLKVTAPAKPGIDLEPLEIIALGLNSERIPAEKRLRYDLDLLPPLEFEMHVETHFPGMENAIPESEVVSVESGRMSLSSLPNLVTEYRFWLSTANLSTENSQRIDDHWVLELHQDGQTLATAKAVFNSKQTQSPRYISWTSQHKAVRAIEIDKPLEIIIKHGENPTKIELQVEPKPWWDLVKPPQYLEPVRWAEQQRFLSLPEKPVDPKVNWRDYKEVWEASYPDVLGTLRNEGAVVEYRILTSTDGQITNSVQFDAFKKSRDRPFPAQPGSTDVVLIGSVYGWPQALRYRINAKGVQDPDEALYGVFLKPNDQCDIEPKQQRKWLGSDRDKDWYFFEVDPTNPRLTLQLEVEDPTKAKLEARWYVNQKPRDNESKSLFQAKYKRDNLLIGETDLRLPHTTQHYFLGPLAAEAGPREFDRISVCTTVLETAISAEGTSVNLLEGRELAGEWTFMLQRRDVNSSTSEYDDNNVIILELKAVPPKKSE